MRIALTTGVGEGHTALAAFDRALYEAGIANFNLIRLSSIIPEGAEVVVKQPHLNDERWGERLYVVYADQREVEVGTEAWAAIGWVQDESTGRGLFVEHHGHGRAQVEAQVHESLSSMTEYRTGQSFGPPQVLSAGLTCGDRPVRGAGRHTRTRRRVAHAHRVG
jgi:arginine decarboxylase